MVNTVTSDPTAHAVESQIRVLEENHTGFHELVELAAVCADERRNELGAVIAEMAAYRATWRHGGLYVSYELEKILWDLAEQGLPEQLPTREPNIADRGPIERVLHVTSIISGLAGLQHFVRRWIELDAERHHSVAVSQPGWGIPDELATLVDTSGGHIELVGDDYNTIMARARRIRELAVGYDLIALHLQTEDVAPILALCQQSGLPPVVLVNHADHAFWLGATVIDRVVNLRQAGLDHCRNRRAIDADRLAVLPTPLPADHADRTRSRHEAREQLDLDPEGVVLLSVARGAKYQIRGDVSYPMIHVRFLREHPQCRLLVVGPDHDDEWEQASRLTGGRITAVGPRSDTDLFYQAADIYVDAYPMVSITSLLEAGGFGLPLVSRCAYPPESAIWCADAPGLDDHLVRCRDLDAYTESLGRLVEDAAYRTELGGATREAIFRRHVGANWLEALEHLYSNVDKTRDDGRDRFPPSPRNLSQPDVLMPELLQDGSGLRRVFASHGAQLSFDRGTIRILARRPNLLAPFVVSRVEVRLRRLARSVRSAAPALSDFARRLLR